MKPAKSSTRIFKRY